VGVVAEREINVKILDQPWANQGPVGNFWPYRRLDGRDAGSEAIQSVKVSAIPKLTSWSQSNQPVAGSLKVAHGGPSKALLLELEPKANLIPDSVGRRVRLSRLQTILREVYSHGPARGFCTPLSPWASFYPALTWQGHRKSGPDFFGLKRRNMQPVGCYRSICKPRRPPFQSGLSDAAKSARGAFHTDPKWSGENGPGRLRPT